MFGASAGLNKPLMRNDTIRKNQSVRGKPQNEGAMPTADSDSYDSSTLIIKNPVLRHLHDKLKCVVFKWIIYRFSGKSKFFGFIFYFCRFKYC